MCRELENFRGFPVPKTNFRFSGKVSNNIIIIKAQKSSSQKDKKIRQNCQELYRKNPTRRPSLFWILIPIPTIPENFGNGNEN